jgi:glycerol-3-phosphate O-acyltransferase/dihydroxyacetone phosphate acyltransferase
MLITRIDRPISFLIAEKSMKRAIVGKLAAAVQSIPVRRAQDESHKGAGKITVDGEFVRGKGTNFKSQVQLGDHIVLSKQDDPPIITEIIDDVTLKVSPALPKTDGPTEYKVTHMRYI